MQATFEIGDAIYSMRCATYFIQKPFASLVEARYVLKRPTPFSHHAIISPNQAITFSVQAMYALLFEIAASIHAIITLDDTFISSNNAIISLLLAVIFLVDAIELLVCIVISSREWHLILPQNKIERKAAITQENEL